MIKETDKEKVQRLERQKDRLKFRMQKQIAKKDEEIKRLNDHLKRGKDLIHRVTLEAMSKQNERDISVARADVLHKMLLATVEAATGGANISIKVSIEQMKNATDRLKLDIKTVGDTYILSLSEVQKEAEDVGEAEQAVVSTPDQEDEPSGDSQEYGDNQAEGLPGNKGTPG